MLFQRLFSLIGLVLGLVGVLACMAGLFGIWLVKSRLDDANERLASGLDKMLTNVQGQVRNVQRRMADSKLTATEMSQRLRDRTVVMAKERVVPELDIESRADRLTAQLQAADAVLQSSTELIEGGRELAVIANQLGASLDSASLDSLLDKVRDAQSKLKDAERSIEVVSKLVASKDDDPKNDRSNRILKFVARTVVTIGDTDTRLDQVLTTLSDLQAEARLLTTRIGTYLFVGVAVTCLLLLWIAAGQIALCLIARRNGLQSQVSPCGPRGPK